MRFGEYNPGSAIVLHVQDEFGELREKLHLVRETKRSKVLGERRGTENLRIVCVRKHLAFLDVDDDDVTRFVQTVRVCYNVVTWMQVLRRRL